MEEGSIPMAAPPANRNDGEKEEVRMVSDDRASSIFREFMLRTAKFGDLVNNIGHQFLTGFCRELGIFKRSQIYKMSDVVDNIIEANQTDRMKAFVDAGCRQRHHDVQNMSNIHSCRQGLEDHLTKVKLLLDELETLKKEAMDIAWMVNDSSSQMFDPNFNDGVEYEGLPLEESKDSLGIQNKSISYATLMTVVYNMLRLDYAMQEKIISSVSLMDTSPEQVESCCTMWDLRPYVNDNIMRQAWKFVP